MRSSSLLRAVACGIAAVAAAAVPLSFTAAPAMAAPATTTATAAPAAAAGPRPATHPVKDVCSAARRGWAACASVIRTDVPAHKGLFTAKTAKSATGANAPATVPEGYGPADLQSAYALARAAASDGGGQTVAVVDAFDDPNAEADLAVYRAQFGLPACTTANGCFRKVAQDGSASYPAPEPFGQDWATEESLDIDMVSAICPNCHILLVEANDNGILNLGQAADEAVKLGAKYVSNSYDSPETASESSVIDADYNHPGVVVTASSGDNGYGTAYPAASQYVTAVGGTTLVPDPAVTRGWAESAWSGAGSGCSGEPKPWWQSDPGCPTRTVADVSAVADPDTGVAIYDSFDQSGWGVVGGTSVGSPIIASVYALAGSPTTGTYPAAYPYADPTALNDVTTGENGLCYPAPAYLCTAGPGYDGPTGLGTPDGTAAFTAGPYGTIAGTITNAATGKPVAGATLSFGPQAAQTAITNARGGYTITLPAGAYTVTVSDFGYQKQSASGVQAVSGQSTTENFALPPIPDIKVTGTVADGSGHGWPLYAKITVAGTPVTAYTSPLTGRYSLSLPEGAAYTIQATAVAPGYQSVQQSVRAGTARLTQDFSLPVDANACDAPGYHFDYNGSTETFDGTTVPDGWTVVTPNPAYDGAWEFGDPGGVPNQTGGTGNFALAQNAGPYYRASSYLESPVIDMSQDATPIVSFDSYVKPHLGQTEEVEYSSDGGQTWNLAWDHGGTNPVPNGLQAIPLPALAGQSQVQFRLWFFSNYVSFGWEVDNVFLGNRSCDPTSGGLVTGTVSDGNTGSRVDGATVSGPSGVSAVTAPSPSGTDGFYSLFVPATGSQQLTASRTNYATSAVTADVAGNAVTTADLTLAAGRLSVTPSISGKATMGSATTATVAYRDTGTLPVTVSLYQEAGKFTLDGQTATAAESAPVHLIHGNFRPLVRKNLPTATPALIAAETAARANAAHPATTSRSTAASPNWAPVADYPIPVTYNATATDPATGLVYSVGGLTGDVAGTSVLAAGYVYDPGTQRWTPLPDMPQPRYAAQAAFIDGKLYVIGGYDGTGLVAPVAIYNPATATWSQGAAIPNLVGGEAVTVLDGKLYVIGGCDTLGDCIYGNVQVYDPATDSWSTAASYPEPVGFANCGTIADRIYCAGGLTGLFYEPTETAGAYVYDPSAGTWSPIAPLPIPLWGSAHADANGELEVSGGVTDDLNEVTNQGYAYNPGSAAWTPLPNSSDSVYGGGSACGLYVIGGLTVPGSELSADAEELPGYGSCGAQPVQWLSQSQDTFTVQPGATVTVTETLNAGDPSITQPGTYTATLLASDDTPYQFPSTAVKLTAAPPRTWGEITGTVTGQSCTGTAALAGATVEVTTSTGSSYPLVTGDTGQYALWLDVQGNPLLVIAADDGWQPQAASVTLAKRATTTQDFSLERTPSCS